MARLPTPNPIDSGYMGRGQCVDHLGSTTIDCKACGSQQRAERYKVILGPTVGFGAPFFVKPFLHRSSTKGMTGRQGIFALCCRCQSFWSEDEGARESLVLQGDDPDGIIAEHMRYEMLNRAAEGLEEPATESGGTETESGAVGLSPTSRVRKLGADTPKEAAVQQPQSVEPTVDVPSVGAAGQVDKWVCSDCDSVVSESATVCPSCGASFDESGYLYRLLNSRAAKVLLLSLGDGSRQDRYQRYEQSMRQSSAKRQSARPEPSAEGKRPIRAWVWVLAALGAIVPIAAPGASLSDVIAGGAAMFFVGWLIDRAIK